MEAYIYEHHKKDRDAQERPEILLYIIPKQGSELRYKGLQHESYQGLNKGLILSRWKRPGVQPRAAMEAIQEVEDVRI